MRGTTFNPDLLLLTTPTGLTLLALLSLPMIKFLAKYNYSVGKTSLLQRYVKHQFSENYKTTIGADFLSKELTIGQRVVTAQLWDTAGTQWMQYNMIFYYRTFISNLSPPTINHRTVCKGQERFQGLGNAFFRGADACVLVFDITIEKSFDALNSWKEAFVLQSNCPDPSEFPFIVIGNKLDMENKREVPRIQVQQWCQNNSIKSYFETSAKGDTNVNSAFEELAKIVVNKLNEGIDDVQNNLQSEENKSAIRDLAAKNEKADSNGCC